MRFFQLYELVVPIIFLPLKDRGHRYAGEHRWCLWHFRFPLCSPMSFPPWALIGCGCGSLTAMSRGPLSASARIPVRDGNQPLRLLEYPSEFSLGRSRSGFCACINSGELRTGPYDAYVIRRDLSRVPTVQGLRAPWTRRLWRPIMRPFCSAPSACYGLSILCGEYWLGHLQRWEALSISHGICLFRGLFWLMSPSRFCAMATWDDNLRKDER